ncbi:cysteine proteinase [Myriangium duriaei CBS 260.36]|uniref:ubiquitinyl hydrolase 1 n=1 Tax=Myriangium duriaei CBS 260.36 TaxID=1168546 RepID=A0A9P4J5V1_9PEZI|nr:cysteine proteinase [Myriangium duriaei CBS 260.36]
MIFAPPDHNPAHGTGARGPEAFLPGKTAPRLVHDALLLDPIATIDTNHGFDLLADPAANFDGSRPLPQALPRSACSHEYALKASRTHTPPKDYRPSAGDTFEAHAVCRKCRLHTSIRMTYPSDALQPCPNADFPLHHFILSKESAESSYVFRCSSHNCRAVTTFTYHPPVIHISDLDLLTNPTFLSKRYHDAVAKDTTRTGFILSTRVSTLWKLRRYIRDSLKPDSAGKKIPVENKRFLESFGSDCDELFRRLGFVYIEEEGQDASWALPQAPQDGKSRERNFLENWDFELQALIDKFAAEDGDLNPCPDYSWTAAKLEVERIVSAHSYAKVTQTRREESGGAQDHPFYASLGAMRDFSDDNIVFSYERQTACSPQNGPYYFDCLQDLANGRQSESLIMKASILESEGIIGQKSIDEAYRYLGFAPSVAVTDEIIIDRYRSRMQDTGPSAQPALRAMLKSLASARQSRALLDAASDTIDTYDQALSWLGAVSDYPDESIVTLFTTKVADDNSTEALARRAVKVIADHRNSEYLRNWLTTGETQETGMSVDEACAHLKIQLDTVDESMLQLVFDAARSDNPGWKTDKAIETVTKAYKRPKEEPKHSPESWPVGLTSHGNTCYLNSLLQYYFTIKPLRDLVAHFDDHKFDLSTHGGKDERVGSRKVTPLEIRAYQKFVEDLKHLFERMIRDPGPAVKPEADLVCRAFLKAEETETQTASQSRAQSPPADIGIEQPKPQHAKASVNDSTPFASSATLTKDDVQMSSIPIGVDGLPPSPPTSLPDTDKIMKDTNSLDVPPLPPRQVSTPVRQQTNLTKAEEAARQQQDVTEVMDEILFRLRCAIKPSGMDTREEQLDMLREIFYMKISERTIDEAGKEVSREDDALNILLNIPSRPTDIYSALDEVFELQTIDHGSKKLKQYKTLQSLPPLLQINIPRNTYDRTTGRGVKVEHKIHLEETLYLDRYYGWENSEIQDRRVESWRWRQQLSVLEAQRDVINRNAKTELAGPAKLQTLAKHVKNLEQCNTVLENLGLSPIEFDESLIDDLDSAAATMQAQLAAIDEQIASLQDKISSSFGGHKNIKYRLHSAFFHRGGYGHGHYWTCIFDFQNSMWRIYNDEKVDELTNVNDIFDAETWQQGTPTYAVYVRDDLKDKYVQSVCRAPENPMQEAQLSKEEPVDEVMQDVQGPAAPSSWNEESHKGSGDHKGVVW